MNQKITTEFTSDEVKAMIEEAVANGLKSLSLRQDNSSDVKLLKTEEVMELLKCSKQTVNNYIRKGILPAVKLGDLLYFQQDQVLAAMKPWKKGEDYESLAS